MKGLLAELNMRYFNSANRFVLCLYKGYGSVPSNMDVAFQQQRHAPHQFHAGTGTRLLLLIS